MCRQHVPHKRMRWHPADAEPSFPAGAQLFTDGSCFEGQDPRTAAAGFSVVWWEHGKARKVLYAGVPDNMPQTAVEAEHLAFQWALHFATGKVD
eukprot:11702546-Prorocentrum_lima.AAC.1